MAEEFYNATNLPTVTWELWTPEKALQVIRAQERFGPIANRPLRPNLIDKYANDLIAGKWPPNGATVVFHGDRLLDGQHRLHAILKTGISATLLIVRGVSADAMPTIDTGLSRTPGDTVRAALPDIVGGYYNAVAAAARIVHGYLNYGDVRTSPERQPTRSQLVHTVESHQGIVDSVKSLRTQPWLRPKVTAAWHYLCGIQHKAQRERFFNDLIEGVNLSADRPVRLLRERMLAERSNRAKVDTRVLSAYIVKAWTAELSGRQLRLLRLRDDEPFPLLPGDEALRGKGRP